jgi:hypothetical protein
MEFLHESERVGDVLEHMREQQLVDSVVPEREPWRAAALEISHTSTPGRAVASTFTQPGMQERPHPRFSFNPM